MTSSTILLVAVCGFLVWNLEQPPFDLLQLDRLAPGTTQAEVRTLVGHRYDH